jgi:hypothetical protein
MTRGYRQVGIQRSWTFTTAPPVPLIRGQKDHAEGFLGATPARFSKTSFIRPIWLVTWAKQSTDRPRAFAKA